MRKARKAGSARIRYESVIVADPTADDPHVRRLTRAGQVVARLFPTADGWKVQRINGGATTEAFEKEADAIRAAGYRKVPYEAPAAPEPGTPGWLDFFDLVVFHTSGGKDSQTAERRGLKAIRAAGALGKTAALHLVLDERDTDDPRIEWQQVPELAAEQSARNGLPLAGAGGWAVWDARAAGRQVDRAEWAGLMHYARRDFNGDLLDDFATRKKRDGSPRSWATMWTRYCTSDWKTAVGMAFTEFLCEQIRRERGLTRPVRVLQVMGFRAQESEDRAAREPFGYNYGVSAKTKRHIWEWLPIHEMTVDEVWDDIRESGVPYHPVYDEGMSRLSCRACIMASRGDLATAKRLAPVTFDAYQRVEAALDDPFQHNKPLALVTPAPGPAGFDARWLTCPTCKVAVLAGTRDAVRYCPAHAATGMWDRADLSSGPVCAAVDGSMYEQLAVFA